MAFIILLNGPPASGKSAAGKQLIKMLEPAEWAYISHDDVRGLVQSGYLSADGLRSEWDERTWVQWNVATKNCIDLAINFYKEGISSVLDFYATPEEFEFWKSQLQGVEFSHIILLPDQKTELKRNDKRPKPSHLGTEKMAESIEDFEGWRDHYGVSIIDNSILSVDETTEKILSIIKA